jgi:syntaxin-binding protein 1
VSAPAADTGKKAAGKKSWFASSKTLFASGGGEKAPEFTFASSRFVVPLKAIAEGLATDKLSATDFPPVAGQDLSAAGAKPAAQSVRAKGWGSAAKKPAFTGGRSLIFIAGGITHAEMQAAAEVSAATNKEVVVGGTSLLTPAGYLAGLAAM